MKNKCLTSILAAVILWSGSVSNDIRTFRVVRTDKTVAAEFLMTSTDAIGKTTSIWLPTEDSFKDADIFRAALMVSK